MEENINNKKLSAELEALLFIYGEPLEIKKLTKILNIKESELQEALLLLETDLNREERGLSLIQDKNKIQLATKPEFAKLLESITKQEFTELLTPAALETLSIVTYAGPITRADIEYIRGVNSSFILRSLLMRGLVEREADLKRSNAYVYKASFDLLRHLGLSKIEDLPDYQKYKEIVLNLHQKLEQKYNKPESTTNNQQSEQSEQIDKI